MKNEISKDMELLWGVFRQTKGQWEFQGMESRDRELLWGVFRQTKGQW